MNESNQSPSPANENNNNKNDSNETQENDEKQFESIKKFFGGPYIDENDIMHDISYTKWVEEDINIKKLCTPFEVVLPNDTDNASDHSKSFGVLTRHDYGCELKLIKWITEDESHKNNFIKIGNKGTKINRHNDILPYTFNAVPLDLNVNEKNLDNYINASYIDGPIKEESKLFIATQSPLKETIPSFWKMILTHKIKLVIMLSSGPGEAVGRNTIYWPEDKENPLIFEENNLSIEFVDKAEIIENGLILKKFKINKEFEIKQIHIICWPDHGMPKDQNLTNDIFETMISYIKMERKGENASPIVVHCSAGVGRTGTLIAVYEIIMCLEYLKKLNKPLVMNIFNVVRKLREQRYSLVTDTEQYKFIYEYSLNWIKKNYLNK
jgi:protein tyrosine phosphatase